MKAIFSFFLLILALSGVGQILSQPIRSPLSTPIKNIIQTDQGVDPGLNFNTIATSSSTFSFSASVWLAGSGSIIVSWGDGSTTSVTLSGTLTEYTHSYSNASSPAFRINTITGITQMKLELGSSFVVDFDNNVNNSTLTALYYFDMSENTSLFTTNPLDNLLNVTIYL